MNKEGVAKLDPPRSLLQSEVATPDVPPNLVKCIDRERAGGKTADQKVANLKLTADERKACAKAILAWYKKVQAANKQAAAKP